MRALLMVIGVLLPAAAQAQELVVQSFEHGEWGASIAALQTDQSSEGGAIHVVVVDGTGARARCGAYQLVLDDAGSRAFDVGSCDPSSSATELLLVDRLALFAEGDVVSLPRRIGIAAMEIRRGNAVGGASLVAETELRCSMAARPYLVDLATGARVPATPDRFELRPIGQGAVVEASAEGWTVRSGSMRLEYELVDRGSSEVVLRESVELQCGAPTPAAAAQQSGVVQLVPDRVFRGATITRSTLDRHGSCGGDEGPEQWYVVRLDSPKRLDLRLVSEFDATLYVRAGSIDGQEIACRDEHGVLETLEINLAPGLYYVAVDGSGTHGSYRLMSFEAMPDEGSQGSIPRARLDNHRGLEGELVSTPSGYHGSCGGEQAPEHVYWFRLDRPSFVAVRLESHFDSALYMLSADGAEVDCRRMIGLRGDTRQVGLRREIGPGLYYVIVDGQRASAGTGRYSLELHHLPLTRR